MEWLDVALLELIRHRNERMLVSFARLDTCGFCGASTELESGPVKMISYDEFLTEELIIRCTDCGAYCIINRGELLDRAS